MTVTEAREQFEKLEAEGLGETRVVVGDINPHTPVDEIVYDSDFDTVEVW